MPIAALAAIDDVWRKLDPRAALFYLASLLAVCAVNYILFSVSTLYYLGYPLLLAYILYAVRRYWRHSCVRYHCVIKGVVPTVVRSINKVSNVSRLR